MLESFHQTLGRHFFRRLSEKFRFSEFSQCRFSSVACHPSPVPPGALRTASPPWPEHRTPSWTGAGVGGGEHRRRRQLLRWQSHPWRPTEPAPARYAVLRRPTLPSPPRGLMHASAPLQHRRRGPASTGRALCRRRARAAPFCRNHPARPIQPRLDAKRSPWTSTSMINLLISPTKHCAAVTIAGDPRSRPPP